MDHVLGVVEVRHGDQQLGHALEREQADAPLGLVHRLLVAPAALLIDQISPTKTKQNNYGRTKRE